eukprot:gene2905-2119_t
MSNTTDTAAQAVHGTNPQYLVEKITRLKIYNCTYWKEECFGLTAATIIDKAVALKYLSGTYGGNNKPSKFMCLLLKMLQLQPDHDIVLEFIRNDDFKYLRALGAIREDDNREQRDDSRHRTSKPTEEPEEKLEAFSSKAAAPKKPVGEKVFDKIFGKKKPAGGESTNSGSRPANGGGNASDNVRGKVIVNDKGEKFVITASEGTVEYWNQMREALGMKKLRA